MYMNREDVDLPPNDLRITLQSTTPPYDLNTSRSCSSVAVSGRPPTKIAFASEPYRDPRLDPRLRDGEIDDE